MKRPIQARALATRNHILDTAEDLFEEVGFAKAGMNALARRANISVGGLYEWFADKEAVLIGIAERHVDSLAARLMQSVHAAREDGAGLDALVRAVLAPAADVHAAHPRLHRLLYTEAPRPPGLQARLDGFQRGLEAMLAEELVAEGAAQPQAARCAALAVRAGEALLHAFVLDEALPDPFSARLEAAIAAVLRIARG